MAENRLDIDGATITDNPDIQQIEFEGEIDGERYQFAARYEVLESLSGIVPDEDNAIALFGRYTDTIAEAALVALGHDADRDVIVVGEEDLMPAPDEPGASEQD